MMPDTDVNQMWFTSQVCPHCGEHVAVRIQLPTPVLRLRVNDELSPALQRACDALDRGIGVVPVIAPLRSINWGLLVALLLCVVFWSLVAACYLLNR